MEIVRVFQVSAHGGKKPFAPQDSPGRWTSGAEPAIYASCQASTALLEFLAHLEGPSPGPLSCARLGLRADQIETLQPLPDGWEKFPYGKNVQRTGDDWLSASRTLALRVPSVLAPAAHNLILNPAHPEYAACLLDSAELFHLDGRLG